MLKAEFTNGIDEITVKGLTQWDSGQEIEIVLAGLPASFEIHFAHFKTDRQAYVLTATAENGKAVAKIPNILLKYATNAVAWIYLVDGEARETVKTINLPITPRPQPSDYVYEETEVRTIYTVVEEALRNAKESGEFDGEDGYTPQREVDYWTAEDVAEVKGYIKDELGNYEECLEKIIDIQGTINREFATSVTDNRTSLAGWYSYLSSKYTANQSADTLYGPVIDEIPFPTGTKNITEVWGFAMIYPELVAEVVDEYGEPLPIAMYAQVSIPARKFTGVLDIPKVTRTTYMFGSHGDGQFCIPLEEVGILKTPNVTDFCNLFKCAFYLQTVRGIDLRSATFTDNMFFRCGSLTNLKLTNIAVELDLSYSELLTLESLVGLIYELRNTNKIKTLNIGSANLRKLENVYVRTIDITDEMRAEDDLIDEKFPFEVCESSDEGAMLITNYVSLKNWSLS